MLSTKHAMKWILSLCASSDRGCGNLADVRAVACRGGAKGALAPGIQLNGKI